MVDLKDAVRRAKEYAVEVLELDPEEMLLEEVRPSNDHWAITLSFYSRIRSKFANEVEKRMRQASPFSGEREFKSFRVNKNTGEVEGMFNVQPA